MRQDVITTARADIRSRIDAIAAHQGKLSLTRICHEVDSIRHIARCVGLEPVERLASMLESALALDGHGPVVLSYLDIIRDAADCEDRGPQACASYAGMMQCRMGGC
jgi:hypothetical protein